jgi:gamma-glutamyl-gamma-aminobutyrate hydrolase PuuD
MLLSRSQFIKGLSGVALSAAFSGAWVPAAFAAEEKKEEEEEALEYANGEPGALIEDATLYKVDDEDRLHYNVVYADALADDVTVSDSTGGGVDSLDALLEVMGTADAPATKLTTDPGKRTLGQCVHADVQLDKDGKVASIDVVSVSARPVVGISWKRDEIGDDYVGFAEAFERNGAIAVFMPQVTSDDEAVTALDAIDGIFMTGGEDWNPKLYGQVQTPHGSSGWNDARDTSDIAYMQNAIAMDLPMLCVCRGAQGLNIALGGALIQDIPSYLAQKVLDGEISEDRVTGVVSGTLPGSDETVQDTGYTMYDENYEEVGRTYDKDTDKYMEDSDCIEGHLRVQIDGIVHSGGDGYHVLDSGVEGIGISSDSKWMYDIAGGDSIDLVATAHHQAIDPDQLGDGLTIVATSSDGIVEGVEYQDNLFALAIQFHPERDALRDTRGVDVDNDTCNAFLSALVEHAGEYAEAQSEAEAA